MSTNNLRWSVTLTLKKTSTKKFRNWMENDHIPKIHQTGFFEKGYHILFEEKKEGQYDVIQYIHTPISSDAWREYNEGPRLVLREEFMKEWADTPEADDCYLISITAPLLFVETP